MAFNINGQIRLAGPNNLGQIVSNIKSQLQGITANVNINVPSNVTANVQGLAQNLNQVSQAAQTISNTGPQAAAGLNNMAGAAIRTSNATSQTSKSLRTLISSQYELGRASSEGTDSLRQFGEQAALAARRFVAFSVAAGSLISLFIAFKRGIGDALEFERQLIRLSQVGGDSSSTIRGLGDEITRVSRAYGASSNELAQVAVTIRQAGISANETKSILEALAKSNLSASFDSMGQSAEGLIAIMSQFRIQGSQAAEVLGSINAVSAGLAVEARDITAAVQRAGGAFAVLAGNTKQPIENLREFIAIFSSVRATTRESAESIATGLRTIFSRLQNTATLDLLEKFNIRLRLTRQEADLLGGTNIAGNFVGVAEAIDRISARLQNVSQQSQTFADIVEQLGGQRQLSKVLPLLTETGSGLREQARALSQTGALSLDDSAEKGLKGLLVQARQTGAAFAKLFQSITENTAFRTLAKSVLLLGSAFADALTFLKPFVSLITILAGVKLTKALLPIGEGFISRLTSSAGTNISGNINQITTPKRFALGGRVEGSGPTDSQYARVSPGEFILNPKAARGIGYDRLQKYNSGGIKYGSRGTILDSSFVNQYKRLTVRDLEGKDLYKDRLILPGYSVSEQLTEEEKLAVLQYSGNKSFGINKVLRGGTGLIDKNYVSLLDTAINKGRLPEGLNLYRGIDTSAIKAINSKFGVDLSSSSSIGKIFQDEGFLSTTLDKGTSTNFGSYLLNFQTQKNDKGLLLDRSSLSFHKEAEILLPRNQKFQVLNRSEHGIGLKKLGSGGRFDIRSLLGTPNLPDVFRSIIGDDKITNKLNSIIPAESKFFAPGTEAMTLLSPDNNIFRLGALGQKDSALFHATGSIRYPSKLFLHPYDTHDLGYSDVTGRQVVLERLKRLAVKKDNAFSFEEGNTAAAITNLLAAKEGFSFDSHGGNVGVDHDIFKIIDPGLVSTHRSMLKLAEKEAPFNYADFLTKEGFVSYNKIKSVKPKFATGGLFLPDETSRFSMDVLKAFGYSKRVSRKRLDDGPIPLFNRPISKIFGFQPDSPPDYFGPKIPLADKFGPILPPPLSLLDDNFVPPNINSPRFGDSIIGGAYGPNPLLVGDRFPPEKRFYDFAPANIDLSNKPIPTQQELLERSLSQDKLRIFNLLSPEYLQPKNIKLLEKDLGLRPSGPAILNKPQITVPPEYIGNQDAITLAQASNKNFGAFDKVLASVGLGNINPRVLTSGLLFSNIPQKGAFHKKEGYSLIREGMSDEDKIIAIAHEVLGHGGDSALGGGKFITSRRKVVKGQVFGDELVKFGRDVARLPSLSNRKGFETPGKLASEGLATATGEYFAKKLYDLGYLQLTPKRAAIFQELDDIGAFKYIEEKYLPRLAELTTGTSPESVKARKSLRKKLQIPESAYPELLGNLSKVQGFKDGGSVIPGRGNTDNVLANLPHGSFIIRKSSAQSIGYDALHQMAGKSSLSSSGGSGLALTMPGEFYFGPDQVKKIGTPILNSINKTGRLPAFAAGGPVGGSYVGYTGTNVVGITDLIGRSIGNVISKLASAISSFTGAVFKSEQLVEKTGSQFVRFADQSAKARGEKFEPTGAYGAAGVAIYKAANRAVPAGSTSLEADLFSQSKATEFLRIQKEIADNRKEIKSLGGIQSDISGKSRADLISSITPAAMTGQIQNPRLAAFFAENKLDPSSKVDVAYGISAARQRQLELKQRNEALQEASGVTVNAAGDIVPNGLSPTKSRFQKFKDVLGFGAPSGTREEQAQRRQIRALSLAYAAPVVAAGIDAFGGSADEAVRSGSSSKYIGSQGTSGALTGASTGFLITGSPIGAVIGGLIGLTVSLVDSSKQIREAKIGEEIQKLATNFTAINTEFSGTGSLSERNRNNQSVAFGNASRLILDSRFGEIRNSGNREDRARTESDIQRAFRISGEGGELTPEQTTLTQQFGADVRNRNLFSADNLQYINIALRSFIRNNPNATSEDFGSQINEILGSRTLGAFFQSQILGGPRGTELQRTRLIESERIRRTSVTDEAQTNFLFSNLGLVSQQLAASLDKLKNSVDQADNAIQGTGRVASVGFDASIVNRPFDANFTSSIRDASSFLGEAGAPLNSFANTLSGIFQPLQNALINVNRANVPGTENFDIGTMVENELRNNLPADSANSPLVRIISANAAKFRENGLLDRGADVSAIAKQLIEDAVKSFGPAVREVFEAANKRLNTVIEGLNRYNQLLLQSVEFQNRSVQIRVATEKTQAQFTAQNLGLGDSATSIFFGANQARSQFIESQGNLLNTPAIRGILGNDTGRAGAAEVGSAFRNVLAQINNFGPVTNANVTRFSELQDASARLRRSLESLADPTQRNADIQERLNRIQGSEQSRGSFNARYFTASPEERSNISQGVGLVRNIVSTGRDIGSYGDEERSQIINTLQSLGRTNLAFAGGASGEEVLNQILSRSRFGIEQAQGEGGQVQDLQRQFITGLNEARTANDALAVAIRENATVVQNNLTTSIRALDVTIANLAAQLNAAPLPTTNSGLNLPSFLDEMFAPQPYNFVNPFAGAVQFGFAGGGKVPMYASAGMFAPRGTDTVPAMLTPDEFVVRREQALANQALLEHINSSSGPVFSSGSVPPELRTRISPNNPFLGNSSRSETPTQYRPQGGPIRRPPNASYLDPVSPEERARRDAIIRRAFGNPNPTIPGTNGGPSLTLEELNFLGGGPTAQPPQVRTLTPSPTPNASYLGAVSPEERARRDRILANAFPQQEYSGINLPSILTDIFPQYRAGGGNINQSGLFGIRNRIEQDAPNFNPGVMRGQIQEEAQYLSNALLTPVGRFSSLAYVNQLYNDTSITDEDTVRSIVRLRDILRVFENNRINSEILPELNRTIVSGQANPFSAEGMVLAQQQRAGLGFIGDTDPGLLDANSLYQAGIARNLRRAQNADLYYGDQAQSIRATAQGNIQGLGDIRRGFGFYNPATGQSDNLRSLGARSNLNFGRNARAFRRFEDGGPVSGPGVGDSIPALLANGEYVINAQAVRNAGGVATFDRINRFQNGGAVGTPTGTTVSLGNGGGSPDFSRYVDASNSLSASMMVFNENARQLAESMKNFPTSITMEAKHTVEVIINGAEAFSRIKPEIQEMIITTTKKEISRVFKEKLPDVQPD